jgi:hypothetical protein
MCDTSRQALTNSCFTHTLRLVVCSSRTTAVSVDSVFIYWGKGNGVKAVLKTLHHNVVISFSTPSGNDWTWQKEYHSTCFTDTQRRLRWPQGMSETTVRKSLSSATSYMWRKVWKSKRVIRSRTCMSKKDRQYNGQGKKGQDQQWSTKHYNIIM